MKVIREVETQGVTAPPPPPKEISSCDLSKGIMWGEVWIFTLMEETSGNWIVGNLHVLMWLHDLNDHSTEVYKIWWSSFEWSDLVVPIFLRGRPWMSSPTREDSIFNHHIRWRFQTSFELGKSNTL
jgi:hypothetical protein